MKTTDLAYVAGIIDGEGGIRIKKIKDSKLRFGITYALYVYVTNRDEKLLKWLQSGFGGSINSVPRRKETHGACWCWTIKRRKALELLRVILPYLRLKRAQAEIAIEFQRAKRLGWSNTRRPKTEVELALERTRRGLISQLVPETKRTMKVL